MKKQTTLDFLVRKLDNWPRKLRLAPAIHGYTWISLSNCKGKDKELYLFDKISVSCKSFDELRISKKEWLIKKGELQENNGKKIYVAGPVSNYANNNKLAFVLAEQNLKKEGYIVLSTARISYGLTEKEYMRIAITMLECCEAIYMLKGWKNSLGACAEYALAKKLGLEIIEDV